MNDLHLIQLRKIRKKPHNKKILKNKAKKKVENEAKNKAMKEVKKVEVIVTVRKMKPMMMKGKVEKKREMKVKVEIKMGKEMKVEMTKRVETKEEEEEDDEDEVKVVAERTIAKGRSKAKLGTTKCKKLADDPSTPFPVVIEDGDDIYDRIRWVVEVVTVWKVLPLRVGDRAYAVKMTDEVLKHLTVIG
ncbi:hypothetical protein Scep_017201 [Stephania cephalantha]|uniref:Uncharacterized protein n=1 Tax=Stephania cephalantha TaxID=152367 RepID=A0AAP0NU00_9MAGN